MRIKRVLRFDPSWPKLRLFRVMWERGKVGSGGVSTKLVVALRPKLFAFNRAKYRPDGWRVVVLGVELHLRRSWGGIFV